MRRTLILLVLILVGGLVLAVYALRVDRVSVEGLRRLPARTVVEASGVEPGDRILWIRMSSAERRVEQLPGVASATAERVLPGTVVIHVTERVPLARLDGAPELVVDASGSIFPAGEERVPALLYRWRGRPRPGSRVDERSRTVLRALRGFPPVFREWGRRIYVGPPVVLTLSGGTEIRFGAPTDLEAKAHTAAAVLKASKGVELAYIDVRSPTAPVSRRREPGSSTSPAVSPSPGAASSPTPLR
jgi:cell division septal protein FtsQ